MKKLIAFCSLFLFVCANHAFAAAPTEEQLWHLTQVLGILQELEAQKAVIAKQTKENAEQSSRIMATSIPKMSEDLKKYIQEETERFLVKVNDAYDTEGMARAYAKLLGTKLSAEEVNQILAFYETPIGKKFTKIRVEITGPWTEQFMTEYNNKVATYTQEYIGNLTHKMMSMPQIQNEVE